jgi:excisionase family DNA binding protein
VVQFRAEALSTVAAKLPTDEAFLTTEEVLAYLQVNLRTVYRLIQAGKIPAVRVGRQWRFRKRDVDAWLDGQRSNPNRSAAAPALDQQGRGRVLVVDDEASIRELLTLALVDYEVDTAADATTALERIRASPEYDLMIADLKMPGMDGLALIREVRQIRATMPVIIVTGFSTESSAIDAVNLGVSAYLTKPFGKSQVVAAAAKALGTPAA